MNTQSILNEFGAHLGWIIRVEHGEHGARALMLSNEHLQKHGGGLGRDVLLLAACAGDTPHSPGVPGWLLLRTNKSVEIDPHRVEGLISQVRDQPIEQNQSLPVDAYSQIHRSYVGIECDVLGTYYANPNPTEMDSRTVAFGSDVDFLPGGMLFNVYKPKGESLERLINLARVWPTPEDNLITLGKVRYTDTRQLSDDDGECDAKVDLKIVLGGRVAMFGKTRSGKSNAVKLLARAIMRHNRSQPTNKVGQLIFDVNGEYCRPNPQDPTPLASLGTDQEVVVYSEHQQAIHWAGRPIPNLYVDLVLGHTLAMANETGNRPGNDAWQGLLSLDLSAQVSNNDTPEEADLILAKRLLWRILLRSLKFDHHVADDNKAALMEVLWPIQERKQNPLSEKMEGLCHHIWHVFEANRKFCRNGISHDNAKLISEKPFSDPGINGILQMINGMSFLTQTPTPIQGRSILSQARSSHCGHGKTTLWSTLQAELDKGRLTILDLSGLSSKQVYVVGRYIAKAVRSSALRRFTNNHDTQQHVILYLEEAHNLIGRAIGDGNEDATSPWALVAKDGAKLGLGMVYSTQEVTDIEANIRANTETILAFHLNSGREIQELTQRRELERFSESISRNQRPGHAKLSQRGLPFALPITCKIYAKQDERELNEHRAPPSGSAPGQGNPNTTPAPTTETSTHPATNTDVTKNGTAANRFARTLRK